MSFSPYKLGCDTDLKMEIVKREVAAEFLPHAYSRMMDAPAVLGNNNEVGDCVIVCILNYIREVYYRAGREDKVTDDLAIPLYSKITGYIPGEPSTDQGTNPEDALNYWKENPIADAVLVDFTRIDHTDQNALKNSIVKTGAVMLICEMSVEQQEQKEWLPIGQPGSWGGHCVAVVQYVGPDYTAITWAIFMPVNESYMVSDFVIGAYELSVTLEN